MATAQSTSRIRTSKKSGTARAGSLKTAAKTGTRTTAKTTSIRQSAGKTVARSPGRSSRPAVAMAKRLEQPVDMPEDNTALTLRQVGILAQRFIGPLPPPEILAKYERAQKGTADRLLNRMENEHVIKLRIGSLRAKKSAKI